MSDEGAGGGGVRAGAGDGFRAGRLELDAPGGVLWAGAHATGRLTFTLRQPLLLQAIYVEFLGEAKTEWRDQEIQTVAHNERTREIAYRGTENYFDFSTPVLTGPTTLNPGTHTYDFQYLMPKIAPSSFEHELGRITYTLRAYVDFGNLAPPQPHLEIVRMFTIVAPYDMNTESSAREPINIEFEVVPGSCFCCESGPLTVNVSLPVSGYCPGQFIPFEIMADNQSNVEVHNIYLSLRKKLTFHSDQPCSDMGIEEDPLITMKKGPVPSNSKRNFTVKMEIPAETPTNFTKCRIIDVQYYIRVEIKISGCNEDMEDEADIIIGTVPLTGFQDRNYEHPLKDRMPQTPLPQTEVAYPSNTPYSTPLQTSPTNGYPGSTPYLMPVGFQAGILPNSNPPYPSVDKSGIHEVSSYPVRAPPYPTAQSPGYPVAAQPPPYAANNSYPAAPYPVPGSDHNASWQSGPPANGPSAPPPNL